MDNLRIVAEILSDSTVNAPLIKVGEIHSKLSSRTYLYNFAYDSIESNESSFLECLNDQDLAYIFDAPLVSGMNDGFFQSHYTKAEARLSETMINYFTNFIKRGYLISSLIKLIIHQILHTSPLYFTVIHILLLSYLFKQKFKIMFKVTKTRVTQTLMKVLMTH